MLDCLRPLALLVSSISRRTVLGRPLAERSSRPARASTTLPTLATSMDWKQWFAWPLTVLWPSMAVTGRYLRACSTLHPRAFISTLVFPESRNKKTTPTSSARAMATMQLSTKSSWHLPCNTRTSPSTQHQSILQMRSPTRSSTRHFSPRHIASTLWPSSSHLEPLSHNMSSPRFHPQRSPKIALAHPVSIASPSTMPSSI